MPVARTRWWPIVDNRRSCSLRHPLRCGGTFCSRQRIQTEPLFQPSQLPVNPRWIGDVEVRAPPPRHRPRPRLAPAPLPRRAPPPGATAASCHRAPPHRVARTATTNTAALLAHTHREPRAAPPRHHRHRAAAPPRRGERRPPGMPRRSRRRPSCARCSSQQLQWVPDGRDGINGRGHPRARGGHFLPRVFVADPARTRAPCVMRARFHRSKTPTGYTTPSVTPEQPHVGPSARTGCASVATEVKASSGAWHRLCAPGFRAAGGLGRRS